MSKTKLLLNVVEDVRSLINSYQTLAEDLQELCEAFSENGMAVLTSDSGLNETSAEDKTNEPTITLEEVRTVLAKLAQDGKQAELKALIGKYGAKRLSEVESKYYPAILKEAEAM
ncbi:MAG: rRNA biogenesis protein rrp5 [Carnobacterium sp.]|nr:rRNA biogenesis protein rrp5 [Carnobacterium sp.]DAR99994.1 MAG TPA: hypothetical protein [Caudoviricetes sp.]